MAKAVICPVCDGKGKIRDDKTNTAQEITCHGCFGRGWVEVSDHCGCSPPKPWGPSPDWYPWGTRTAWPGESDTGSSYTVDVPSSTYHITIS